MSRNRLRFWLLSGASVLAGVTVLFFAFDEFSVTRGLVDDGVLLVLVFMLFVTVPVLLCVVYVLGRRQSTSRTRRKRLYTGLAIAFLAICWLITAPPAVFWGALIIAAREPWPLSLAQGPDTERATNGAAELFGADAAAEMSAVYFFSFQVRDASYFARFEYADPGLIERIAIRKDLVAVPIAARDDGRFDVRAHRNRWSWWKPDEIQRADALYVDRPTSEKMSGSRPRNQPTGFSRVLWVDRKTRTAYYREIEF